MHAELVALRRFLVPHWKAWGEERGKPVTEKGEGMCRFTSACLTRVLGKGWRFCGGFPEVYDWTSGKWTSAASGYFDGERWHAHHWVRKGSILVDLTASQFDGPEVVVTTTADARYREALLTPLEVQEALRDVQVRATQWARAYAETLNNGVS